MRPFPVPKCIKVYFGDDLIVLVDVLPLEADKEFLSELEDIFLHFNNDKLIHNNSFLKLLMSSQIITLSLGFSANQ